MWRQILDKMRVMHIDQVDYTLVHGAFHHQVPKVMHSSPHIHNADQFADITRYHVFANHIHTPSVYRNILGGGSLDCMRHGEEHDKGYMYSWVTEHSTQHNLSELMEGKRKNQILQMLFKSLTKHKNNSKLNY